MKIKNCHIKNFTVFEDQTIEFCDGINVVIGANGSGKSHLLKILYAMSQSISSDERQYFDEKMINSIFFNLLNRLFKPENELIFPLKRNEKEDLELNLITNHNNYNVLFTSKNIPYPGIIGQLPKENLSEAKGIFIPPNDVLSIYPGFTASYEKRELAFDQTYYDACKALSATPLKKHNELLSKLIEKLEAILEGKVVQKGDRFYVQSQTGDQRIEAHLMAEGHRKIAALLHLVMNGSIDTETILFWDEPEANMNPRLIKELADVLRILADAGVQIFLATHDYLLTGELSIAVEYQTNPQVPVQFIGLSQQGNEPVQVQSGNTLAKLDDNPIVEEFAAHYDRERTMFYDKEAVVQS